VLRDLYVRGKYRDVILPMTVLRRLDAVLEPTTQSVLDMKVSLDKAKIVHQDQALRQAAGQAFYNTSKFTLRDLRARASQQQLKADFEAYLDGFSSSVQEILENFEFRNQIPRLSKADALGTLIEKFLSPDINLSPNPILNGQEINAETFAICKADLLLKGEGDAADNIIGGPEYSTLPNDDFPSREFDFMLSNPPYGKSWKGDLERLGGKGGIKDPRFIIEHSGDPEFSLITRSSDGQMLFLANMLSKMKQGTKLGSRIAEVHNGSSLFTGDAGQGECNIRSCLQGDQAVQDFPQCRFRLLEGDGGAASTPEGCSRG
jgi:type I restriction-modification system DNA methylase subunit